MVARSRSHAVARSRRRMLRNRATAQPSNLFFEQRVKRLARVVRSKRLLALVRRKVPHDLRLEERAFVFRVFSDHALRDVLAALPQRGRVEEAAVAAGVEIGGALEAGLVERHLAERMPLLAAAIALECFRSEAARRPPARRAFESLLRAVRPRALRALLLLSAGVRVSASVLISLMPVFTIAQRFTSGNNSGRNARAVPQ